MPINRASIQETDGALVKAIDEHDLGAFLFDLGIEEPAAVGRVTRAGLRAERNDELHGRSVRMEKVRGPNLFIYMKERFRRLRRLPF
jgi:hypothetical protein